MSEVQFRLSQLREAAERMSLASTRIDTAVQEITVTVDTLLALGYGSIAADDFVMRYQNQRANMQTWAQLVNSFAINLTNASDDLENALLQSYHTPITNTPIVPVFTARGSSGGTSPPTSGPTPETDIDIPEMDPIIPERDDYLSAFNQPAYDDLVNKQDLLDSQQDHLDGLIQQRQDTVDDLAALKNRLKSYDPDIDLSTVPRVQVLEAEIIRIDNDILSTEINIENLNHDIDDLTHRLDLVRPGPGADLKLIASLEKSETSGWIRENTQDCVRHIVDKMPIPPGIPHNAYLWDDMAAKFPQYGITTGDVPLEGAVIVLEKEHPYSDDVFGHLFYVEKVEDGIVWVTDNEYPDTPVRLTDLTTETTSDDITYLYFPWHTRV